jgi:hypothetical protein
MRTKSSWTESASTAMSLRVKTSRLTRLLLPLIVALALRTALVAHHKLPAFYDVSAVVSLKGTLTRVEWQNPHVMFYVDVVNSAGSPEAWIVEGDAPAVLTSRGWARDTLKQGDAAILSGYRPTTRNARFVGGAAIELRDGRRLLFGENLPR